ncbi:TipAS antibiotic-recognition domain-containing protein [Corynebacterium sanguinis]|uniref:TipAS antibiotic-recognition domain-containing protein n=1 Tax=Corynebacterium sanguinis TaxID=2594913 RepID=UPI0026533136|nr:TipAS antibiotic-recognition domain-containing protein [Corynebacterium sanguinis]MDN8622686.1 TipAS antibiotic-recognition domain-containing protein [Corynebacterium sanguinis]
MPPWGSPQGELLRRHRTSISEWYEVTASRQLILARMYVADERFGAVYGGQQDYLLELVEA